MSTESPYHFDHLLQVSNKSLWILILYTFFNVFPHVYSPGAEPCHFAHLLQVSKKYLWSLILYIFLVMWPRCPRINFRFPDSWRLHMKFGFDWPRGFGEEDLWKWWTDNGWMDDRACLYYKLTNEPKGSGELIRHLKCNNVFTINVKTIIEVATWNLKTFWGLV